MRVLLDECVPRKFGIALRGKHEVKTIPEMGWSGLSDAEVLDTAEGKFDVFITVDRNMEFQQNLKGKTISVLTIRSANNRIDTLRRFLPEVEAALVNLPSGTFLRLPH